MILQGIELIKRYFIARNLCKRYGYKFRLFNYTGCYNSGWMNPFSKEVYVPVVSEDFYSTLFHEIGHVVDYKIRGFRKFSGYYCDKETVTKFKNRGGIPENFNYEVKGFTIESVALREMLASRFAVKLLRKTNRLTGKDVRRLNYGYNSYLQGLPQHIYADASYRGFRKIGGCDMFYD